MQTLNIEAGPRPDGGHWATLLNASDALAMTLEHWRLALRLANEDDVVWTREDSQRVQDLELVEDLAEEFDIFADFNAYALEMRVARWDDYNAEPGTAPLARVVIVTGTGGPHVEVSVDFDSNGSPERITQSTYWSGEWTATTTDGRALSIANDYLAAIVPDEG
jgi:hypothetical protein